MSACYVIQNAHETVSFAGNKMQIFVKGLPETMAFEVEPATTLVDDLQRWVEQRQGIPPKQQRLVLGGKQLERGNALAAYDVHKDATIRLNLCLCGGYLPCGQCNETGVVPKTCSVCHGSGRVGWLGFNCNKCDGGGKEYVRCSVCNGNGRIVRR